MKYSREFCSASVSHDIDLLESALVAHKRGDFLRAERIYRAILVTNPSDATTLNMLGTILFQRCEYAESSSTLARAVESDPFNAHCHATRGVALWGCKKLEEATKSFDTAIKLKPDLIHAHINRGHVLIERRMLYEALASYEEALKVDPKSADALYGRGATLIELGRLDEALFCLINSLHLNSDHEFLLGTAAHLSGRICDWEILGLLIPKLAEGLLADRPVARPFSLFPLIDDPLVLRRVAEKYVSAKVRPTGALGPIARKARGAKIHVAYLSGDYHEHATSYLMAELFESHDRDRFEITAVSFGPVEFGDMRQRLMKAFDRFIDVRGMSDVEAAKACRALGVDIAIDLKGYLKDARPGIIAERCAPIQINYLGFPGTMGSPFVDYIIADDTIIESADYGYYSEKVIVLPGTYQVNDSRRRISDKVYTRAEAGLPENGFVFCSFNNNYKISPSTFDVWMRILHRVPASVLWLLEDNPSAAKNLRSEAANRGVDPSRLIFAKRIPLAEHLSRHRLADLFIDTWPCNAHTTASDALWAGLPTITRSGRSFASRVAASLLRAVGMEDLVTKTDEEYENLAVSIAHDPQRHNALKARLAANRESSRLFDGRFFAGKLEAAFERAMDRHWRGLPPDHIVLADDAEGQVGQ